MSSRDKILECAKYLFYHVGYQTTSVDDILRQCGVAKSNFYYHFKTKEQLALEVLEIRVAEYETVVLGALHNEAMAPSVRLAAFFDQLCRAQRDVQRMAGCPFGNLAATLPTDRRDEQAERLRRRLSELFLKVESAVRDCLAAGVAAGEVRGDIAAEEMAAFVVAAAQGLLILAKTHQDMEPLVTGAAVVLKLLKRGETKPAKPASHS